MADQASVAREGESGRAGRRHWDARVGVDTGGTFTDFAWLDEGRLQVHKVLSTLEQPAQAVLTGLEEVGGRPDIAVVHGTTVATNALLERRGARTALITTAGFADVLAIGRQNRPDLYALVPRKPPPLVPARWRFEVGERVTAQGHVLASPERAEVEAIRAQILAEEIQAVAVCLLFSFLHPEHEAQVRSWLLEGLPGDRDVSDAMSPLHISLSSEILPEYREYERTSTTVINAYVAPKMSRYLRRLAAGVAPRPLAVMQSNGGIIDAAVAGEQAARTALSGPAAGVVGARHVAAASGFKDIIAFDMGGTSTDVALCPGRLPVTGEGMIAGMPLRLPMIDIHTVGAGGGSLAYLDAGGALRVGPQSAGADPGPACYGRPVEGWQSPLPEARRLSPAVPPLPITVTDANLVLGRLDAAHFLGGTMRLDEERARAALTQLGAESVEEAALDLLQVANATMERAIRAISVERGHDPRAFTLVAYGGAGPLHACDLATALQIPRVLVPRTPGVLSALGMVVAVPTRDYSVTTLVEGGAEGDAERLPEQLRGLAERGLSEMTAQEHAREALALHFTLDMRYVGQSHELNVPLVTMGGFEGDLVTERTSAELEAVSERFHQAHAQRFGYRRDDPVEIVTARLEITAPSPPPSVTPVRGRNGLPTSSGQKKVWFREGPASADLYQRRDLGVGARFRGPAIIFQYDTTTVIPPDWIAHVDEAGNLLLERAA